MRYDELPPPVLGASFREIVAWAGGRVGYCDVDDVTGRQWPRCTCGWAAEAAAELVLAWPAVRRHVSHEHGGPS